MIPIFNGLTPRKNRPSSVAILCAEGNPIFGKSNNLQEYLLKMLEGEFEYISLSGAHLMPDKFFISLYQTIKNKKTQL